MKDSVEKKIKRKTDKKKDRVNRPSLKLLHPESSLIQTKLKHFDKLSNQELIDSLRPGQSGSLKVRPDGTMIEGHHRIKILRDRGVDVDSLPREIVPKN